MLKNLKTSNKTHSKNLPRSIFKLILTLLCLTNGKVYADVKENTVLADKLDIKSNAPLKIAYIMKAEESGNPYWPRVRQGAEQAAKAYNVNVDVLVAKKQSYDINAQIDLVKSLKQSGINGLIITPIDTQALSPSVDALVDVGIPVIVHDTPLNSNKVLTQLSFDNFQAGFKVATWVNQQLKGKGQVTILGGQAESFNAIERRDGFLAGLSNKGQLKVMDIRPANWSRGDAKKIVQQWLTSYPDISAIIAASDSMALGAMEAILDIGRQDILITGIDASQETLQAIANGHISATVDQAPEQQAKKAVQLMIRNLIKGETYPEVLIWDKSPLITKENVKQYLR